MNKLVPFFLLLFFVLLAPNLLSQNSASINNEDKPKLFSEEEALHVKFNYSNREVKRNSNDSTYIKHEISFRRKDGSWEKIEIKTRRRGNNRLKNCYFAPLKMKIKKSIAAGTPFEGNRKLKVVLPCLLQRDKNDNVLKEFMAYKIFEAISPYHFKTRLVKIDYNEIRGNRNKAHELIGILIEDIDNTAKRYNGDEIKKTVHPLAKRPNPALLNDFFQFMIGNTDYSTSHQHNQKLLFIDKKIIPIPYDFDMSGLVDASYAVVSNANGVKLDQENVRQRLFRGFKRDVKYYQQTRRKFLDNKSVVLEVINNLEADFNDPRSFKRARNYILSFFEILESDKKFKNEILNKRRTK